MISVQYFQEARSFKEDVYEAHRKMEHPFTNFYTAGPRSDFY